MSPAFEDRIGVLLMGYGSPDKLDDLEAYYTHIRGGRKLSPEAMENLRERYRRIGGHSPFLEITQAQARALEQLLNDTSYSATRSADRFRVYVGMLHWRPFIHDAISQMISDGIRRAVGLTLTPHYSRMSVGAYIAAAQRALRELAGPRSINMMNMYFVKSWHLHPLFIKALAERVREGLTQFTASEREGVTVVFTAHSLPERIREWDDPYPRQFRETCEAVAQQADLKEWRWAYQSAARTPEPWLKPDILELLDKLGQQGRRAVLICPVGAVADHLEILYDIDVECRERAERLGLHLERVKSLNDDPQFIQALAAIIGDNLQNLS